MTQPDFRRHLGVQGRRRVTRFWNAWITLVTFGQVTTQETEMHLSNLERYEIQAEAFRRMTGHLAPGKDAAAGSYDEVANRTEIYARWAEIHGECVYAVLDAVDCVLRAAEDDEK